MKGLLSVDERIRLLRKIINTAGMNQSVRELAREIKGSAGFVSRCVNLYGEQSLAPFLGLF